MLRPSAVAWIFLVTPALAQSAVTYRLDLDQRAHHVLHVEFELRDLPPGPVELVCSRSSPGRYALHEFSKNLSRLQATDLDGNALPLRRLDVHRWSVAGHAGAARVRYRVFADRADGTFSGVYEDFALLNTPAWALRARGLEDRPHQLQVELPEGWRAVGPLVDLRAPDWETLVDSPLGLGPFRRFERDVAGFTLRAEVLHGASDPVWQAFLSHAARLTAEAVAVWEEVPTFADDTYTLLVVFDPLAGWDSMEHRDATVLSSYADLHRYVLAHLANVTHEVFHIWNVERLRPASLEPFDLEGLNPSGELWFAEGFTQYYEALLRRRAGLIDDAQFAQQLGGLLDQTLRAPARPGLTPRESSFRAPYVDAARWADPTDDHNVGLSYYVYGAVVALSLDLTLRLEHDTDLDAYLRALWARFGRTERPYGPEDLREVLGEVAGDPAFAEAFFAAHVDAGELPDVGALLARFGFRLRRVAPNAAWAGALSGLVEEPGGLRFERGTAEGSPWHAAGLDRGDVLRGWDDAPLTSVGVLRAALRSRRPGESVRVRYLPRGRSEGGEAEVELVGDPRWEVVVEESGAGARARRQQWLRSRVEAPPAPWYCPVTGAAGPARGASRAGQARRVLPLERGSGQ